MLLKAIKARGPQSKVGTADFACVPVSLSVFSVPLLYRYREGIAGRKHKKKKAPSGAHFPRSLFSLGVFPADLRNDQTFARQPIGGQQRHDGLYPKEL